MDFPAWFKKPISCVTFVTINQWDVFKTNLIVIFGSLEIIRVYFNIYKKIPV